MVDATHRTLADAVLQTGEPAAKIDAARRAFGAFGAAEIALDLAAPAPPQRPARPTAPELRNPGDMPRRRLAGQAGRVALLHAVAHIEFNAIDLAFDMAARFAGEIDAAGLDARDFVADWFAVGDDEARHFSMIADRLAALGAAYGDLPAHDGLWRAAEDTADAALARLAVAPMVLEARGLDVTPGMIERLEAAGDVESAAALRVIYDEEVGHVATGVRWFRTLCAARALEPQRAFEDLVRARFAGALKPPFNVDARARAGLEPAMYERLS
ncbi:MAG: ferritin-like domain-containing protein [Parvularculaceae bacterium]